MPIEVTVSPGDLTKDGIIIYSAAKPVRSAIETPGPQNGWNKTRFEWAPDRAADIQVVEAPGPNNAWRRLVIRSTHSRNSIILVQWNTIR